MATLTDLARRIAQDIKPLRYDSGLRDITSLAGDKITGGSIRLRRSGKVVTLELAAVAPSSLLGSGQTLLTLPAGFRRPARWDGYVTASTSLSRGAFIFAAGGLGVWTPATTDSLRLDLTWITNDPPPATPPGSPA